MLRCFIRIFLVLIVISLAPPVSGEGGDLSDNLPFREWCEETFVDGLRVYEAYKKIAFEIEFAPEGAGADYWQTPLETDMLKRGDCEDVVLLFWSMLPPDMEGAEIVWGWVIDKQAQVWKAHVWYRLIDRKGREYVVEGFSNDWNGIIPVETVQEGETRDSIAVISHITVSELSRRCPEVEDWRICPGFPHWRDLCRINSSFCRIMEELHDVFTRFENQKIKERVLCQVIR